MAEEKLFYTGQAKRTGGSFTVRMKKGDQVLKRLNKLQHGGENAIKRTVSDFSTRAPGWVKKGIRQHYGVDVKAINEAGPKKKKGASHVKVAGVSVDGATLEYKGRTLTPTHFNQSPKSRPATTQAKKIRVPGQAIATAQGSPVAMVAPPRKYTVKATIIKGSRAAMAPGTFIAAGKGGSELPFQRTGGDRTPIEAVHTLSVPQMISGRAKETIEETISTKLEERFNHHIDQAMKE